MREYKPLKIFTAQTDALKKLIADHPDLPIVVIVNSEVVADYDFTWWYAPYISFSLGEILDCDQDVNDQKIYVDRRDLEEDLEMLIDNEYLTDKELEKLVKESMDKFEPYWQQVIQIRADV